MAGYRVRHEIMSRIYALAAIRHFWAGRTSAAAEMLCAG
jgi:hypothetical protein